MLHGGGQAPTRLQQRKAAAGWGRVLARALACQRIKDQRWWSGISRRSATSCMPIKAYSSSCAAIGRGLAAARPGQRGG